MTTSDSIPNQPTGDAMIRDYRKKSVTIQAAGPLTTDNAWDVSCWCKGVAVHEDGLPTGAVVIETLEGTMRADPGDYIIRGVQGEFYPCKPDIFAATYEAVDAQSSEPDDEPRDLEDEAAYEEYAIRKGLVDPDAVEIPERQMLLLLFVDWLDEQHLMVPDDQDDDEADHRTSDDLAAEFLAMRKARGLES